MSRTSVFQYVTLVVDGLASASRFGLSRFRTRRHSAGLCPPCWDGPGDYSITGFALSQYAGSVKKIFAIRALSPSRSDLESSWKKCKSRPGRLCLFRNIQAAPFYHASVFFVPAKAPIRGLCSRTPDSCPSWFRPKPLVMTRLRTSPPEQDTVRKGPSCRTEMPKPTFLAFNLLAERFDKPCRRTGKKCRKGLDNPVREVLGSRPQVARPDRTEERGWRSGTEKWQTKGPQGKANEAVLLPCPEGTGGDKPDTIGGKRMKKLLVV